MIPESSYELIHLHVVLSLHSTRLNYFPFPSAIFSPPTFSQLHSPQQELPQLRFPWTGPLHTTQSAFACAAERGVQLRQRTEGQAGAEKQKGRQRGAGQSGERVTENQAEADKQAETER